MNYYGVTDLYTYILGAIGIVLLPGPNSLYVLSIASAKGVKKGYQAACGVFVGDTALLLATVLGAAGLLRGYPSLFLLIQYLGAAYLAWMGWQLLRTARQHWFATLQKAVAVVTGTNSTQRQPELLAQTQNPFLRALLISLLNPKAIVFLLSFFVQFVDPSYPNPALPFFVLSAIVMAASFVYLSTLICAGARLATVFGQRPRLNATLTAAVGALFIGFALRLILID